MSEAAAAGGVAPDKPAKPLSALQAAREARARSKAEREALEKEMNEQDPVVAAGASTDNPASGEAKGKGSGKGGKGKGPPGGALGLDPSVRDSMGAPPASSSTLPPRTPMPSFNAADLMKVKLKKSSPPPPVDTSADPAASKAPSPPKRSPAQVKEDMRTEHKARMRRKSVDKEVVRAQEDEAPLSPGKSRANEEWNRMKSAQDPEHSQVHQAVTAEELQELAAESIDKGPAKVPDSDGVKGSPDGANVSPRLESPSARLDRLEAQAEAAGDAAELYKQYAQTAKAGGRAVGRADDPPSPPCASEDGAFIDTIRLELGETHVIERQYDPSAGEEFEVIKSGLGDEKIQLDVIEDPVDSVDQWQVVVTAVQSGIAVFRIVQSHRGEWVASSTYKVLVGDIATPRTEPVTPREEDVTPREEDVTPREEDVTPREEPVTPREEDVTPREEDVAQASSQQRAAKEDHSNKANSKSSQQPAAEEDHSNKANSKAKAPPPPKEAKAGGAAAVTKPATQTKPRVAKKPPVVPVLAGGSLASLQPGASARTASSKAPVRHAPLSTPRQGSVTPRQGSVTPRQGSATPRQGSVTPRQGSVTPRQGSVGSTPRGNKAKAISQRKPTPRDSSGKSVSPKRKLNDQGRPMKGREYVQMYGEWMEGDDEDEQVSDRRAASTRTVPKSIQERLQEQANTRPTLLKSQSPATGTPQKVEGSSAFAKFYNRQVDLQVQHNTKNIDAKADRLMEELDQLSEKPAISSKSERLAKSQPKLSTMYDEVRKERERQKELLAVMHTPRPVSHVISQQNDAMYYEQKQWKEENEAWLEEQRQMKEMNVEGEINACAFTPRILNPGGKPKVPFQDRLYTPRSNLKDHDSTKHTVKLGGSEQDHVESLQERITGIKRRQKDPIYRNNQMQRKMAKELQGLQSELKKAKAAALAKTGNSPARPLSVNEKKYMSKGAQQRWLGSPAQSPLKHKLPF